MSIASSVEIPGVKDNAEFSKWIEERQIKFHSGLSIDRSELGGVGLYFDGEGIEEGTEDLEILRVPYDSSLDYISLLKVLEELKERDQTLEFENIPLKQSELILNVLTVFEPNSETQILACYLIAFKILRDLSKHGKYYSKSPLTKYYPYLDILLSTPVLSFPDVPTSTDGFVTRLIQDSKTGDFEYQSFIESFNVLYRDYDYDFQELMPNKTFHHLIRAIRSRTLEIPHEAEVKETEEKIKEEQLGKEEEELENIVGVKLETLKIEEPTEENFKDFYTNVTLVPVLDFANHLHANNAYFDVDVVEKAIILKLTREHIKTGKFEVTISYAPVENISTFIHTYGFVPKMETGVDSDTHVQLLEVDIELPGEESLVKAKWLGVAPRVQLVIGPCQVYLNLHRSKLALLFLEGLEYNRNWHEIAAETFRSFNDFPKDTEIDESEVIELIRQQEISYDVINGVPPIGLKLNGKVVTEPLDLEPSEAVTAKCVDAIIQAFRNIVGLQSSDENVEDTVTRQQCSFRDVLADYFALQHGQLALLIKNYEEDKTVLLPECLIDEEWDVYRTPLKALSLE